MVFFNANLTEFTSFLLKKRSDRPFRIGQARRTGFFVCHLMMIFFLVYTEVSRIYTEVLSDSSTRLVFIQVSKLDAGNYTCVVGPERADLTFVVHGKFLILIFDSDFEL